MCCPMSRYVISICEMREESPLELQLGDGLRRLLEHRVANVFVNRCMTIAFTLGAPRGEGLFALR